MKWKAEKGKRNKDVSKRLREEGPLRIAYLNKTLASENDASVLILQQFML